MDKVYVAQEKSNSTRRLDSHADGKNPLDMAQCWYGNVKCSTGTLTMKKMVRSLDVSREIRFTREKSESEETKNVDLLCIGCFEHATYIKEKLRKEPAEYELLGRFKVEHDQKGNALPPKPDLVDQDAVTGFDDFLINFWRTYEVTPHKSGHWHDPTILDSDCHNPTQATRLQLVDTLAIAEVTIHANRGKYLNALRKTPQERKEHTELHKLLFDCRHYKEGQDPDQMKRCFKHKEMRDCRDKSNQDPQQIRAEEIQACVDDEIKKAQTKKKHLEENANDRLSDFIVAWECSMHRAQEIFYELQRLSVHKVMKKMHSQTISVDNAQNTYRRIANALGEAFNCQFDVSAAVGFAEASPAFMSLCYVHEDLKDSYLKPPSVPESWQTFFSPEAKGKDTFWKIMFPPGSYADELTGVSQGKRNTAHGKLGQCAELMQKRGCGSCEPGQPEQKCQPWAGREGNCAPRNPYNPWGKNECTGCQPCSCKLTNKEVCSIPQPR